MSLNVEPKLFERNFWLFQPGDAETETFRLVQGDLSYILKIVESYNIYLFIYFLIQSIIVLSINFCAGNMNKYT